MLYADAVDKSIYNYYIIISLTYFGHWLGAISQEVKNVSPSSHKKTSKELKIQTVFSANTVQIIILLI